MTTIIFLFLQGNCFYSKDSYNSSLHTYSYLISYVIVSIDSTIRNNTFFFKWNYIKYFVIFLYYF